MRSWLPRVKWHQSCFVEGSSGSADAAERSKYDEGKLRGAPGSPSRTSGAALLISRGSSESFSEQREGAWSSYDEKVRIIEFLNLGFRGARSFESKPKLGQRSSERLRAACEGGFEQSNGSKGDFWRAQVAQETPLSAPSASQGSFGELPGHPQELVWVHFGCPRDSSESFSQQ